MDLLEAYNSTMVYGDDICDVRGEFPESYSMNLLVMQIERTMMLRWRIHITVKARKKMKHDMISTLKSILC